MNNVIRTYSQFIEENSSNQSKLFRESKRLLNIQADVCSWMINDKTKFLVIGTSKQLSRVSVRSIRVADVDIEIIFDFSDFSD